MGRGSSPRITLAQPTKPVNSIRAWSRVTHGGLKEILCVDLVHLPPIQSPLFTWDWGPLSD